MLVNRKSTKLSSAHARMKEAGNYRVIKVPKLTNRNQNFLGPFGRSGSGSGITGYQVRISLDLVPDRINFNSVSDPD
jgi:hypothetical protein